MEEEGLGDLDHKHGEVGNPEASVIVFLLSSAQLLVSHIKPQTAAALTFIRAEKLNAKGVNVIGCSRWTILQRDNILILCTETANPQFECTINLLT